MIVTFSEEIRDAVEVIMRPPTTDQKKNEPVPAVPQERVHPESRSDQPSYAI
jgi:hypothetical protein